MTADNGAPPPLSSLFQADSKNRGRADPQGATRPALAFAPESGFFVGRPASLGGRTHQGLDRRTADEVYSQTNGLRKAA